ncbi:MAG TPA: amidohydrolase family protein [Gemmatimonadaceae bacterium]|jgi:predicted TIM-barrel fold metal-dependent hydrolase
MPQRLIDVHAHVFNLGYVPVQGILQSRGAPKILAVLVAKILEGALEREESLPRSMVEWIAQDKRRDRPELDGITEFVQSASPAFLEAHARDIHEAARRADADMKRRATKSQIAQLRAEAARVFPRLEPLPRADLRKGLWDLLKKLAKLLDDGHALVEWLLLLLSKETRLVETLNLAWPESDLFVHHMMDMDSFYAGHPLYPFLDLQLRRMRVLSERSGGRLLTFVAYDPFRSDAVDIIRRELHNGCAGVKFYPPSGYRPIGNTTDDLKGTGQDPDVINCRNTELFALCTKLNVPILAHCSRGGMERVPKKTGELSDPSAWRTVLHSFNELRLCLGHAGGDDGWCAPRTKKGEKVFADSFAMKVISLCSDANYPNVYCEFGHTERLFDETSRANFAGRLGEVARNGADGERFLTRVMYGSDWHLLARVQQYAGFDDIFRDIFRADKVLAPHAERFFRGNALQFLNLPAYVRRNDKVLTSEEKRYLNSLA